MKTEDKARALSCQDVKSVRTSVQLQDNQPQHDQNSVAKLSKMPYIPRRQMRQVNEATCGNRGIANFS